MENPYTENNWLRETYELLKEYNSEHKISLKKIAAETDLRFGWLNDFSRQRSQNPAINYVWLLRIYLKQQLNK